MKTAHKQVLALVLALALLLSLCACAQKTQPESDEPKMSTDKVRDIIIPAFSVSQFHSVLLCVNVC